MSDSKFLPVPSEGKKTGKTFKLDDVLECFNKPALIRELVYLVGGTVVRGEGNDVDVVIRAGDFPPALTEAILFRLFRAFSSHFNIPYDETPKYLHITINDYGPYTDYIPLFSLALVPRQPVRIFRMSQRGMEIIEKSQRELIVGGYAATSDIDAVQERISEKALQSIFKSFKQTPEEFRNLMWDHTSTQIGVLLEKHEDKETYVDEKGWYIIGKLRYDIPVAKTIAKKIIENPAEFGFSVKIGVPGDEIKQVCLGDVCFTEIEEAYFIETSVTPNPANPATKPLTVITR